MRAPLALIATLAAAATSMASTQEPAHRTQVPGDQDSAASRDLMLPRGAGTKTIDFVAEEGTNLSLDASPKGSWMVFDLLGHVYRMDSAGGAARALTQGSGVALNITPTVSPDGRHIAFSSDRSGQLNLWVMGADGSAPRALTHDAESRYVDPAWAPDGRSIAVVRRSPVRGFGLFYPRSEIWSVQVDGGAARLLVKPGNDSGPPVEQFGAPAFSPDGRFLYFHRSVASVCVPGVKSSRYRLQRLELSSGHIAEVRPQVASAAFDCAEEMLRTEQETEPHVSPDGRLLAFALTSARETLSFRGHDFRPGTALMVRDLATGEERRMASPIAWALVHDFEQRLERSPSSISWAGDGRRLLYMAAGRIHAVDLSNGGQHVIPFAARVHRVLSEPLKPRRALDTADSFASAFLQWPTSSPDGQSLAFIAGGNLWIARRDESTSRPIEPSAVGDDALLYTPSWSTTGDEIAFSAWGPRSGGHVWQYSLRTGELKRLTRAAGRYLYPAWGKRPGTLVYLYSAAPLKMSPQMYASPFDDSTWEIIFAEPDGRTRKLGETERPHRISIAMDGRIRYLQRSKPETPVRGAASSPLGDSLSLQSVDPDTLATRTEVSITPVPWYWPETLLSPDEKWISLVVSNRAFACRISRITGRPRVLDIGGAASFDDCVRLDRNGAWFSGWRDDETIEYTDGTSQVYMNIARNERRIWPVSTSLRRPQHRPLLLRNATLIALDRGQPSRRGDIQIIGRRIACVGQCAATPGTEVIDLSGKFVMPGIIDTHDHTTRIPNEIVYPGEWKGRASLAYGVTTRYDPFTRSRIILPMADLVETGRLVGPRTFGSGDVIGTVTAAGGPMAHFDYEWPLSSAADAEAEVTQRSRLGVPILKYYWSWNRAQGQLVVSAARRDGRVNVTSEALSINQDLSWVMDGQLVFEHSLAGMPIYQDVTRFVGMSGIVYTPTLIVEATPHFLSDPRLLAEQNYELFASRDIVRRYLEASRHFPRVQWDELTSDIQAQAARDIAAYGGRVSVGSHGEIPGLAAHLEVWLLAAAMGPLEALRAASLNGAYKLGLEAELGSIEIGKVADLLVLDADPLADIRNSSKIHRVLKGGTVYSRAELLRRGDE